MSNEACQDFACSAQRGVESAADNAKATALNHRLAGLFEAASIIERSLAVNKNRNFVSMPQTILAAPGIAARDPISGLFGAALGGLITPENQARAGIMLERLRTMPRTPSTFVNRVPYLPRAGTAAAYGGRMQQGLLDRGLLPR